MTLINKKTLNSKLGPILSSYCITAIRKKSKRGFFIFMAAAYRKQVNCWESMYWTTSY